MANLVKISDVSMVCGLTSEQGATDAVTCKKILEQHSVPYSLLMYQDTDQHVLNIKALSTWSFGPDFKTYEFTDMPIVMWKEYYDDYERYQDVVHSSDELLASNLIKNKDKVVVKK